jgi:hypothetical protein
LSLVALRELNRLGLDRQAMTAWHFSDRKSNRFAGYPARLLTCSIAGTHRVKFAFDGQC